MHSSELVESLLTSVADRSFFLSDKDSISVTSNEHRLKFKIVLIDAAFLRRGLTLVLHVSQVIWMRRQRVLRRLLKKYREAKKIDRHL